MKRIALFAIIFSCALALIPAQEGSRRDQRPYPGQHPAPAQKEMQHHRGDAPKPESVTISGSLTLVKGTIAVISSDVTYIAAGLQRYVGFIDGLKAGAAVTLEGNAFSVPKDEKTKFLQVKKLTLSGKDYDLDTPRPNIAPQQQPRQNMNPPMHHQQPRGREAMPHNQNHRSKHNFRHNYNHRPDNNSNQRFNPQQHMKKGK